MPTENRLLLKWLYMSRYLQSSKPGGGWVGGGALEYFLGRYVPPGTLNWHPVLKTISPKIDTLF